MNWKLSWKMCLTESCKKRSRQKYVHFSLKSIKQSLNTKGDSTVEDVRTEQILQLLRVASSRQKSVSGETAAFNLLSALHIEHYETQTHSQIILFLLNDTCLPNERNTFLYLFLQTLKIPKTFLDEQWKVYREKSFDSGKSRIDFVIESQSFCAIIEMKIDAKDGDSQLARYASFGRKKRKRYCVYYLTLDGHEPEEQSIRGVDEDKLMCISFETEIVLWLQNCMRTVKKGSYKYSFLKQYLGAVKHITGTNDEVVSVTDLLNSSEMARTAQIIMNSFYEKMDDITIQFFKKLGSMIAKAAETSTIYYTDAVDIFLEKFTCKRHNYYVILSLSIIDLKELIIMLGFSEDDKENNYPYLRLEDAETAFPSIYRKWMDKLESLDDLPKIRRFQKARWFYVEDTQGAHLNFKNYSAQIKLIDEMDLQCKFICESLVNLVIKPLLS